LTRLRVLSGREVCLILSAHGFVEARRRGSHIARERATSGRTVKVPGPDNKELRAGTLLWIIRQSGVPRSEFEEDH